MTDDRKRRADAIFTDTLDVPAADRPAAIRAACGDDPELLAHVMALADALNDAGGFLSNPTVDADADVPADPAADRAAVGEKPGDRVGPYRLLEEIGHGGFGVVFSAEQERPVRRTVAVKVVKLGMDTREVVARFEAERQALALMDHPNIAKVLDAGATAAGRPYFAMELVRGLPITEYCDRNRLTTGRRVALLAAVCRAVQHAHAKGVIHRDLKPGNVLVADGDDGEPVPKVIDFGIAKATQGRLTDRTLFTAFRQLIGTPQYMSPEQADGDGVDVDTRTDVYGLGVLLYELLVGTTPFDARALRSAAVDEMRRIIRETDPGKPSTRLSGLGATIATVAAARGTEPRRLGQAVRGELDWIVMRALEKDRGRRYDTAAAMADDLGRYLAGEAVLAGPPGGWYRARKVARRHRTTLATAAAVVLAVVAGLTVGLVREAKQKRAAVTSEQAAVAARVEADRQRHRAEEQTDVAETVAQFQLRMLEAADPARMLGDRVTVVHTIEVTVEELDRGDLRDQPAVEAGVWDAVGRTFESLGRLADAESALRRALAIRRRLAGPADDPAVVKAANNLGRTLHLEGKLAEAEGLFREAIAMDRRLLPTTDDAAFAVLLDNLAMTLADDGRLGEAERTIREAVRINRLVLPAGHGRLGQSLNNLATVLEDEGQLGEAEGLFREALTITRAAVPAGHPDVAAAATNLGTVLRREGDPAAAEPLFREALTIDEATLPADDPRTAQAAAFLGLSLLRQGKFADAVPYYRQSLEIARHQGTSDAARLEVATELASLAQAVYGGGRGDPVEAAADLRESLTVCRTLPDGGGHMAVVTANNLAVVLKSSGHPDEAAAVRREYGLKQLSTSTRLGHAEPVTRPNP